jgi:hypothetical protein
MVVAIAKDIGENKNGISRGENYVDNDLTINANKKREYFSKIDSKGHMIKNNNKNIPDLGDI